MKYARRKFSLSLILALALVVLLPVLAIVQYKLLGQVSNSERERMQANLKSSATKFTQDFDREIARAFLCFQLIPSPDGKNTIENYADRYDKWLATSPHPKLVSQVFRVESETDKGIHISELNKSSRRFERCEWPEEFSELRSNLERMAEVAKDLKNQPSSHLRSLVINLPGLTSQNSNAPSDKGKTHSNANNTILPPPARSSMGLFLRSMDGPLEEKIPALVIPLFAITLSSPNDRPELNQSLGTVILKLDLNYIKDKFIPELAQQYFSAGDALEYKLALLSRGESKKIIYQSDADFPEGDTASSDLTGNIFALKTEDIENIASENLAQVREPSSSAQGLRDRVTVQMVSPKAGPVFRALRAPNSEGRWELALKHRAGSLETVVASARRRNLIISFGILLLLGASIAMIIISTRRAERLARQQIEFVAGVTHELRTPLAVIRSAGENLADGVIKESEQVRRYGSLIAGEGRRLTEMVEQVLEFSGIQSGRKTYHLQPLAISDVIDAAIMACKPLIIEGGFEIERETENNLPPVAADRDALSRAIQNLLSNAIKYSGESRQIRIRVEQSNSERDPEVKITIEDHGLGIEAEDLPHLFEPFHRGRAIVAAQIHGNGLGLSLVKHIITAHNGRVTVESTPGRGSSFTLHLPAVNEAGEVRVVREIKQESSISDLSSSIPQHPSYE
jgi:signal transduction histidine kinase